jgi:hypothetical protein
VHPYPYRAVTVSGAPFQTLPVRARRPLAWSAFARHYLRSRILLSFPPATEMVQFAGFASFGYGFTEGYPKRGGLPHSDIRGSPGARPSPRLFAACHVLHRLSVPRHPPDALFVLRSRPAPSTQDQRSDDREQISLPTSLRRPGRCANGSPGRCTAHRPHAYPCSRPDLTSCEMMAGPASHGHDSLHDFNRTQGKAAPTDRTVRRARLAHDPRSRCQRTRQGTSRPPLCVLRHPSSPTPVGGLAHACWWAWADLNGRPHAYQACALTS